MQTKVREEQFKRDLEEIMATMRSGQIQKAYEHISWLHWSLGYPKIELEKQKTASDMWDDILKDLP